MYYSEVFISNHSEAVDGTIIGGVVREASDALGSISIQLF